MMVDLVISTIFFAKNRSICCKLLDNSAMLLKLLHNSATLPRVVAPVGGIAPASMRQKYAAAMFLTPAASYCASSTQTKSGLIYTRVFQRKSIQQFGMHTMRGQRCILSLYFILRMDLYTSLIIIALP
jgi:hypothetical protein